MSMFIVPEPLFDYNMSVEAYRLCAHDGKKMLGLKDDFRRMEGAFTHPGLDVVEMVGLASFTGGKLLFADISQMQLITGIPANMQIEKDKLVCVFAMSLLGDADAVERIRVLGEKGYAIALDGLPKAIPAPIMPYVQYVLLEYRHPQFTAMRSRLMRQFPGVRAVVCDIPDAEGFDIAKRDKLAYLAGDFYSRPYTKSDKPLSPIKVNALHLLSQVSQEDFDFGEIVRTIERDPYLTVSLLKFINSHASGLKKQVDSIRQGVAILGQQAARQWAMIALSVSLGEDRPNEITRLALIRAKFAEGLATAFELGTFQSALFVSGLFSLLDVMLEKPMEEAIKEVAVDARIRQVLVDKDGPFAPVLEMMYAYERGNWDKVTILMIQNSTDMEHISKAYLDALVWYRALLESLEDDPASPEEEEQA